MNAEKRKHQVFGQHRVGAPDLSWEVREGFSEKLQSKDENEETQGDEDERSRQQDCKSSAVSSDGWKAEWLEHRRDQLHRDHMWPCGWRKGV